MFEATESGTLLLTDMKKNLSDLFKEDIKIIAYDTIDEAIEKV